MAGKRTYRRKTKSKNAAQDRRIAKIEKVISTRELKYQDTQGSALSVGWAGTLVNLIAPTQALTDAGRLGDRIAIERIDFHFNAGMTAAGYNQIRLMIIRDKAGGIGTTVANVLDSTVLSTTNAAQSPFEEDQRKNFEVLHDRIFMIDNVSHVQVQSRYKKTFKHPKLMVMNAGTTTVTKGQIKYLLVADASIPNFGYDYHCRIWYSDL